ncbi:MAG: SEC-C metal-binding domain-containing protein, partial [Bacteroidota bacterium]
AIIDDRWKEHLRAMDDLKASTYAASFEQKDPLVVYKMEAFKYFESLIMDVNESTTAYLATGDLSFPENNQPALRQAKQRKTDLSKTQTNRTETQQAMHRAAQSAGGGSRRRQKVETFQRSGTKVGRNDPCPCGSGKKYKKCHGR